MKIPLNVIVEPPPGYWTLMAPRSSTYKLGLIMANSIGVFDPDYCGGEDEYVFIAYNYTQETVHLERGTRIAQILFLPLSQTEVVEMHQTKKKSRGGIGSTGQK
jgi:dUTP pyrophosphatase